MRSNQSTYRIILKATSLFGGVQVFNIIISIVRSKIIAVLLGPTGIGVMGLLASTVGMIGSLTNFGLGTSAIKDIAAAGASDDQTRIAEKVTILRRLVWITGLLGSGLVFVLSPWLSQISFGNDSQALGFAWLSVTLLLSQLSSGRLVILQGMHRLRELAKANLCGSALGLVVTLPLYYVWGLDGIVPGMIGTSLLALMLSCYYSRSVSLPHVRVSVRQTWAAGNDMLRMGFLISLSGLLTVSGGYLVRVFISQTGGITDVGLYSAGFAIINTYVGLIFDAMGTDYYPRLSAIAHDDELCIQTINQQIEVALLILGPILTLFLICAEWVVKLLYSDQFLPISEMIYWAAFGMIFKAVSWAIGFLLLAKGASRLFFVSELWVNVYTVGFNLLGYYCFGLAGLGISFLFSYLIYFVQQYIIARKVFHFSFGNPGLKIFLVNFFLFFIVIIAINKHNLCMSLFVTVVSFSYSFYEFNERIALIKSIFSFIKK